MFSRLVLALALVAALISSSLAQTVVYIGNSQCAGASNVVPVQYDGTGCPASGSWAAGVLAVGTDGTLCYSTAGGSPGTWAEVGGGGGAEALDDLSDVTITSGASGEVIKWGGSGWVDGTIDGSDVGLADSPGSDGNYYLDRASSANSWAALADVAVSGDAADLNATGITDGYVLTADGANGVAWEAAGGGGATEYSLGSATGPISIPNSIGALSGTSFTIPGGTLVTGSRIKIWMPFSITTWGSPSTAWLAVRFGAENFTYSDLIQMGGTSTGMLAIGEAYVSSGGSSAEVAVVYYDAYSGIVSWNNPTMNLTSDITVQAYAYADSGSSAVNIWDIVVEVQ